jgi:hypothetical protein
MILARSIASRAGRRTVPCVLCASLLASSSCRSDKRSGSAASPAPEAAPVAAAPLASVTDARSDAPGEAGARTIYRSFRTTDGHAFALEIRDNAVRAIYNQNGLTEFYGKATDTTHFSVRQVDVAKPKDAIAITGTLSADGKVVAATLKDPGAGKTLELHGNARPLDPSLAKTTFELEGHLGGRLIRMKIHRNSAKLEGVYRYARSAEEIALTGSIADEDGSFELVESVRGKPTGRFVGVIASIDGALATWSSPDGSRSYPVVMAADHEGYPEIVDLGLGLTLYPQERRSTVNDCDVDVFYPQIRGARDTAKQAQLNALLKGDREEPRPCEAPSERPCDDDDPDCARPLGRSFHEEGYALTTKTRGRFVGLEQSEFWYGAGAAHPNGDKTCTVLDTRTLSQIQLASMLTDDGRAKLGDRVTATLQGGGPKLTEQDYREDSVAISPTTNMCLTDKEIVVSFRRYEVAPYFMGEPEVSVPKTELRPFFEKGETLDALFSQ